MAATTRDRPAFDYSHLAGLTSNSARGKRLTSFHWKLSSSLGRRRSDLPGRVLARGLGSRRSEAASDLLVC